MPPAPDTATRPPRAAEIRGLVDNATPDRLFGWAWNPASAGERVAIELRLADTPVATTTADVARPDLEKAGIGDGAHAFVLPLRPEWIRRRDELSVVARAADGTETPIPVRMRRPGTGDGAAASAAAAGLQRAVEALADTQRRAQEQLEAVAARLPAATERTTLDALVEAQAALNERLDTLAVWLARLDERLAAMPGGEGGAWAMPKPRRRLDAWQVVLAVVLGVVATGALALALRLGAG
jgi:hypothetical protein